MSDQSPHSVELEQDIFLNKKDPMDFNGRVFRLLYIANSDFNCEITVGEKITWSPVGSGVLTDITDAGYPRVNHIAVTALISESGLVISGVRDIIEKSARKLNKEVVFSYQYENKDNPEGTGVFPNAKFGGYPIVCDARDFHLEWKITYKDIVEKTEQEIKDEKRLQYGKEIAAPEIESILNNKNLSEEQKKQKLILHCASWIQAYAQESDNSKFYRDIVVQIGEMFGQAAKTSDDGSIQQDVLALKVPEIVGKYVQWHNAVKALVLNPVVIENIQKPVQSYQTDETFVGNRQRRI